MVEELQNQLRELHSLANLPDQAGGQLITPYATAWQDWTTDPFGGGWRFWKIGVDTAAVSRRMSQPAAATPLYIRGEAWSHNQGWVEGALETTDGVLASRFGLPLPGLAATPVTPAAAGDTELWTEARGR